MHSPTRSVVRLLLALVAALALGGCTPNAMIRSSLVTTRDLADYDRWHDDCRSKAEAAGKNPDLCRTTASIERTKAYTLFFIELDEQGRFFDRRQIDALIGYLQERRRLAEGTPSYDEKTGCFATGDVSIVTFVHGWRHNASYDDENVKVARETLAYTALGEQAPPHPNPSACPREVIGVYLGWRGLSTTTGLQASGDAWWKEPFYFLWEYPSVLERKNTAEDMAVGSARELFSLLRTFQNRINDARGLDARCKESQKSQRDAGGDDVETMFATYQCKPVRLLIVGHSFGGLIVYNAVAGQLIDNVTQGLDVVPTAGSCKDAEKGDALVRSYADLILLINPAFEGVRFEPLHQAVSARARVAPGGKGAFCPNQRPVLVAVTSRNDFATRVAFRFTRSSLVNTKSMNSNFGDDETGYIWHEEAEAHKNTIGHVRRYQTHLLIGAGRLVGAHSPVKAKDRSGYEDGLKAYCEDAAAAGGDALENAMRKCVCGGQAVVQAEPGSKDMLCTLAAEEFNAARMLVGEDLNGSPAKPWLTPLSAGNDKSRRPAWRHTFCGGATFVQRNIYDDSERFQEIGDGQLFVRHSPSSPVWNVYVDDPTIVDGHGDLQKTSFKTMIQQLYHITAVKEYTRDTFRTFGAMAKRRFAETECSDANIRTDLWWNAAGRVGAGN